MPYTTQQVFDILRAKFPDKKMEYVPCAGDPYIKVEPSLLTDVAVHLRDTPDLAFDYLMCLSGVDFATHLATVYNLMSTRHLHTTVLHVEVPPDHPWIPSVESVWPTAGWHEREAFDLIGIKYLGHSDLRRILLPEDWEGYPLRKDYVFPTEYHSIPLI